MKIPLVVVAFALLVGNSFGAGAPTKERHIQDLKVISTRVLQRSISPKFYQTLLVSPVEGWIVVRARLAGTHLSGMRVIKSELSGAYDKLALQRAQEVQIAGDYSLGQLIPTSSVLVHLLIYKTADGTLALSFAHLDEPGGDQLSYWGCARLTVIQKDGRAVEIHGPAGLEGKGWAVRRGLENNIRATLALEKIPGS